jgi:hypothetical protein
MKPRIPNLIGAAVLMTACAGVPPVAAEPPPPARPQTDAIGNLVNAASDIVRAQLGQKDAAIRVVEAREVSWASGALGCPNAGLAYIDVVTPGYLIVIEAVGKTFHLHAGRAGKPFICPEGRREPPLAGRPEDVAS